ncbi:MAG: thioredoxin [Thermoplasmata archaeon]|nr:MAG: thioredoxin [Thermoplasmata archaeon]HDN96126.1 thioredoxin [Thermoplasmatales archaeon]
MDEVEKLKQKMLRKMLMNMQKKEEMPSKPLKATDENFDEIISKYDVVVVDFWAPWCGPCRLIAPVIEKLAKEMKGKVVFAKLNVDENPKMAMRYRVMSIPTLILFKEGKMADRLVGALPEDMLRDWVERYI